MHFVTCSSYNASVVSLTVVFFAGSHSSQRKLPTINLIGPTYMPIRHCWQLSRSFSLLHATDSQSATCGLAVRPGRARPL